MASENRLSLPAYQLWYSEQTSRAIGMVWRFNWGGSLLSNIVWEEPGRMLTTRQNFKCWQAPRGPFP
jgi:hypothetical protein